jgi:hypothetical protein
VRHVGGTLYDLALMMPEPVMVQMLLSIDLIFALPLVHLAFSDME